MQGIECVADNQSSLLQQADQLLLHLITHLYVLSVTDGLQELHGWVVSRGACEGRRGEGRGERGEGREGIKRVGKGG